MDCEGPSKATKIERSNAALVAALKALAKKRQFGLCWCNTIAGTYCVGQQQCDDAAAAIKAAEELQ